MSASVWAAEKPCSQSLAARREALRLEEGIHPFVEPVGEGVVAARMPGWL